MIEANVEIYEARAGGAAVAFRKEQKILHGFRRTRAALKKTGSPMTPEQKQGALALLADAKASREAAAILVDEAFDATEPIVEGDE